jgi:hypothetical protein
MRLRRGRSAGWNENCRAEVRSGANRDARGDVRVLVSAAEGICVCGAELHSAGWGSLIRVRIQRLPLEEAALKNLGWDSRTSG